MTTWLTARAALKTKLHGLSVTATAMDAETLTCSEMPVTGQDQPLPFAYILPPARSIQRYPGGLRIQVFNDVKVRLILSTDDIEEAANRMETWVAKLTDTIGDSITLEDQSGLVITNQEFSEFSLFGVGPNGEAAPPYGFEMSLGMNIADTETRSA